MVSVMSASPLPPGFLRQHLIDPESCARCNSCAEACTREAIVHDHCTYAVDVERCDQRMDCLRGCSTGAIDNWRVVPADATYSVSDQLGWLELPAPLPLANGVEAAAISDATAQAGRRPHAPPSAATPVTHWFTLEAPGVATLVESRALTSPCDGAEVRHLVLRIEDYDGPLLEGQSIGVVPPGYDERGRTHHVRLYSVASARDAERPGTRVFAFNVKRVLQDHAGQRVRGVCSNYLCDLAAGSTVSITGPVGETFLMPDAADASLLMVCTGTGIAPMRGMIQRGQRVGVSSGRLALFYGGRTPADLPYRDELAALPPGLVATHLAYSRLADAPRCYVQDLLRVHADQVAHSILHDRCYVYVCGLQAMERGVHDALKDILRSAGADWDQLLPRLVAEGRFNVEVY